MASLVEQHGPFLRVEEAARLLRISRTSAYALANRWLDTDGADGLPGGPHRPLDPHPHRRRRATRRPPTPTPSPRRSGSLDAG